MLPDSSGSIFPGETTPKKTVELPPVQKTMQPLNVMMGVGLLGALFTSTWFFGGFTVNEQNVLLTGLKGGNYRLWGAMALLIQHNMTALIELAFGAGIIIFLANKDQPDTPANNDLYIRRQMWLIAFGLMNALVFLWTDDLLFHLGIMGIFLFPFSRLSPRGLFITAIVATVIFSGKNYWNYSDHRTAHSKYVAVVAVEKKIKQDSLTAAKKSPAVKAPLKDSLNKEQKDEKAAWERIAASKKADPTKKDEGIKDTRSGSYAKVWDHLLPGIQEKEAPWFYKKGIWDFAGMILLGMALYKFNFFGAGFSKGKYAVVALAGIGGGVLLGWFRLQHNHEALVDYATYVSGHTIPHDLFLPLERFSLVAGYASLVMLLINISWLQSFWWAIASAGKMALTNYLVQSIVCTLFFTGIGFGYYGRLSQVELYLFAAEVCLVQVAFSILWLRYYKNGPVEWLLLSAIHWKWLPIKKQRPTISPDTISTTVSGV